MPLQPIEIEPGLSRDGTSYSSTGRWYDCNLVRFRDRYPEKMGGWTKATTSMFDGIARSIKRFSSNSGEIYTAIGTTTHLYIEKGGTLTDITPLRATSTGLSNPIDTTSGSSIVTVTDSSHLASVGDIVIVSGATDTGGILAAELNIEATILTVADANTFTYTSDGTASSNATGGGTVTVKYLLRPGGDGYPGGAGWGAGAWSRGTWGTGVDMSTLPGGGYIAQWSLENYGEDLIINPRFEEVYYWDATSPTNRAVAFSTLGGANETLVGAIKTLVSVNDRHVISFGCNEVSTSVMDRMLVRWSDNEDLAEWESTTITTAGSQRLTSGSTIITAAATTDAILIWTDTSLYTMRWIGGTYVFAFDLVTPRTEIAGYNAAASMGDQIYWISKGGFYTFNGDTIQIPCPIQDYILNDVDWTQADKIAGGTNLFYNEIIWFYSSVDSTNDEPDSYVIYNTSSNTWYYGSLARTAWKDTGLAYDQPLAAGTDGYLYYHDVGFDDGSTNPSTAIDAYIESSPFELGNGDQYAFVSRIIHDVTFRGEATPIGSAQKVDITLKTSDYPGDEITDSNSGTVSRTATTSVEQYTTQTHLRLRGRQMKIRAESTTLGSAWRLGRPRIEVRTDGKR